MRNDEGNIHGLGRVLFSYMRRYMHALRNDAYTCATRIYKQYSPLKSALCCVCPLKFEQITQNAHMNTNTHAQSRAIIMRGHAHARMAIKCTNTHSHRAYLSHVVHVDEPRNKQTRTSTSLICMHAHFLRENFTRSPICIHVFKV
jgi:hypothetical protein